MTERAQEIIDMLAILRENSYSGNPQAVIRDLTIKYCPNCGARMVSE